MYYAYWHDEVFSFKVTAPFSEFSIENDQAMPDVMKFIDNVLSQKHSPYKDLLKAPDGMLMGVGCSCSHEFANRPDIQIYSCIVAISQNVVTKDMTENSQLL